MMDTSQINAPFEIPAVGARCAEQPRTARPCRALGRGDHSRRCSTVTEIVSERSHRTVTDDNGRWVVSGLPSGGVSLKVEMPGFKTSQQTLPFNSEDKPRIDTVLEIGDIAETVTVMAEGAELQTATRRENESKKAEIQASAPSANVSNLQRRVAGVLPVGIDVPRAGNAYRFLRPLVIDGETRVTFNYKVR